MGRTLTIGQSTGNGLGTGNELGTGTGPEHWHWTWAPTMRLALTMGQSTDDGPEPRQWAVSPDGVLGYGRCPGAQRSSGLALSVETWCGEGQCVTWCASGLCLFVVVCLMPNAGHQARGTAGARDERRLFPVACMPLFGPVLAPGSLGEWFLTLS